MPDAMITHVAIIFQGKVWSLPKPNRHRHVIRMIVEQTGVDYVDSRNDDQGFLDELGRYLRRKPAFHIALRAGQLINQERSGSASKLGELYSEDLW